MRPILTLNPSRGPSETTTLASHHAGAPITAHFPKTENLFAPLMIQVPQGVAPL